MDAIDIQFCISVMVVQRYGMDAKEEKLEFRNICITVKLRKLVQGDAHSFTFELKMEIKEPGSNIRNKPMIMMITN